ncbi:Peroxisomal (S)-2-hydroxy-acid oxidase GLO4, partial [Capsicum baccatum]
MAGEPVNVNEFEELARQVLPKVCYDFFAGGAEDQYTLKENIEAFRRIIYMVSLLTFQKISIRPKNLVDVSRINMSPIIVAPTSSHQLAHPEGEVATARGAAACNIIMGLAFTSTCTLEEVASSCKAVRFIQTFATYYSQL